MATSTTVLLEPPRVALHAHHNRDRALQKYLLLHEQHETLRQHLDELRPLQISLTGISAIPTASPAVSPTGASTSIYPPSQTPPLQARHSSMSRNYRRPSIPSRMGCDLLGSTELETMPDDATLTQVAVEEAKLCHVNEGIKRTLTELLNCEAVRSDRALRTWVQCRLMDTERELRSGRRRRSAPEP
ncbi:hypothetical protein QBC46DRAFT_347449 [Diplogelasinospora grovesii]|uniref:Uncharacterized protein n=1 Tax=Diplogelasinospora grovesii TaxID=303347 RepID=A0AAN6MZ89_9PEZI|nr:hypothetical protein QBC46DRAFT_347449 [Diplogelasinospora grovesii]